MRFARGVVGIAMRAALAFAAALAAGCAMPPPKEPPNVLLIVVDTLRADRLGAYGSTCGLTPFLDSVAARGIVFHRAYASSCWTNPSVGSLFTSRHVWQHGVTLLTPLPSAETTLAESLAERGWDTAGWSANFLVSEPLGYRQGFGAYATPPPRKIAGVETAVPVRAEVLNQMVGDWWRERRSRATHEPALVSLQYMEPHWPYAPPQPVASIDTDEVNRAYFLANTVSADDARVQGLEPVYDAEVRALDSGLAQLFQVLERERFLENAVVVLTADHGEGFWDHGIVGHGSSLFDELIHVPLIMLVPGNDGHVDVDEVVSLVDVAPTVLDFADITRPASFEGRSMRALMVAPSWRNAFGLTRWLNTRSWPGAAYSDMALNAESARKLASASPGQKHLRSVVVGRAKLITTLGGDVQSYDLAHDPHEKGTPALAARRQEELRQAMAVARVPTGIVAATRAGSPDEEQERRLRALGYVY